MSFELVLFYVFGAILLGAGLALISVRYPVHSALVLVLAFFAAAAIWLLAEAEFLAIVLVLVYVGAVMVLFLFVVMMLDINLTRIREGFMGHLPVGLAVAAAMATMLVLVVARHIHIEIPERAGPEVSNTAELGAILYTEYVYPFEIAAVILLVAIIAAIALMVAASDPSSARMPNRNNGFSIAPSPWRSVASFMPRSGKIRSWTWKRWRSNPATVSRRSRAGGATSFPI